ncbi:hypothetical protein ACFRCG_44020 [Embleya sp. NPDC056575]|uniref:hypothetical protein n=1 Tax=unclassified Embleya TaxID=2699296 RepID=UPI00368CC2FA
MSPTVSGPAATAEWQRRPPDPGVSGPAVSTLPDSADPRLLYYVPERPTLARDASGAPVLALTLMLNGLPTADESTVVPRIERGLLSCEFALTADPPTVEGPAPIPLFARPARIALVVGADTRLWREATAAETTGPNARVALTTTLDRDETLALLAALDDADAPDPPTAALSLTTHITYRAVSPERRLRLRGNWARVWDAMTARHPDGVLTDAQLLDEYRHLIRTGAIVLGSETPDGTSAAPGPGTMTGAHGAHGPDGVASGTGSSPGVTVTPTDVADTADLLFHTFATLAGAVLFTENAPDHHHLGNHPSPLFEFDITKSAALDTERTLEFTTPLRASLGPARSFDRDRLITLVSVAPSGPAAGSDDATRTRAPGTSATGPGVIARTPRRIRSEPDGWPGARGPLRLAESATPGRWTTVGAFLDAPSARPATKAHRLMAIAEAQGVEPFADGSPSWRDSVVVGDTRDFVPDLPRVPEDGGSTMNSWPSARPGRPRFHAPIYRLVMPAATDTGAESPFRYSFTATPTPSGQPGLTATITFRLTPQAHPDSRPVQMENFSVGLSVPFRDVQGHELSERFEATLGYDAGDWVATVSLIDDWARLAYSALSQPDFQPRRVMVDVAWSFVGVTPRPRDVLVSVFGGKRAFTPVLYDAQDGHDGRGGFLDASSLTYRSAVGDFALRVVDESRPAPPPADRQEVTVALPGLRNGPIKYNGGTDKVTDIAGTLGGPQPATIQEYFFRTQELPLSVPCAQFGAVYVEQRPEGPVPVGCRNALTLGDTSYRQYEEVAALAVPAYRVFRSLQQPGRFLVLPTRYLIGRFPVSDPDHAYRPRILMYSVVDIARPTDDQATFEAVLQADIPPYAWARLTDVLTSSYAANPTLVLPTDVDMRAHFAWTVTGLADVRVSAVPAPDGVRASLGAALSRALLLRNLLVDTGISGSVEFEFPDGTSLSSALVLDLSELTGPPDTGPVQALLDGDRAILANRVERPVVVGDLLVHTGAGQLTRVPVETSLPAGQSTTVTLPGGLAARTVWPVYTVPPAGPASLEEVRAFVEDVKTNVVFADLIDHASHGLTALDVRARLVGVAGEQDVVMTGHPALGTAFFVLPLTTYLARRVLQFRLTVRSGAGAPVSTAWLDWDLAAKGNLVSLTPDLLPVVPV